MDFTLTMFNNQNALQGLTNLSRINVYLIINGHMSLLKNNELLHYHIGDVFHIFDFDQTIIFPHHASLLKLSINHHYFYDLYDDHTSQVKALNYPSNQIFINALYALHQNELSRFKHTINLYFQQICNTLNTDLHTDQSTQSSYGFTLIKNVTLYLNTHCLDNLSCKNIAQSHYVNHCFLSREFSKFMKATLSNYITIAKITHNAKWLLEQSTKTYTWQNYHFHTYNDYASRFEQIYHCSPETWPTQNNINTNRARRILDKNIMVQLSKLK